MGTTRRTFLKLVAATSASALVPFRLIEDTTTLLAGEQWIAQVREYITYDIYHDRRIAQFDIRSNEEEWHHLGVSIELEPNDSVDTHRETALKMLLESMHKDGINPNNLVTLPAVTA